MQCFGRFVRCGRETDHKMDTVGGDTDGGLISEETEAGENDHILPDEGMYVPSTTGAKSTPVRILLTKQLGELLGLRLFKGSLEVQSIEPDSALAPHLKDVPMGSFVSSINGVTATIENVRRLLRECRGMSSVTLIFIRPPCILPLLGRQRSNYVKRLSYSSNNSSSRGYSPTPSYQWRRSSDTAGSAPAPIDFSQLSKDFPRMWTRSGRGSLPTPRAEYGGDDPPLTERICERASTSLC
jgi:hypothetical protein